MKKRKRNFLLLELLIAITLLTLFSIPLITEPFYLLKKEIAALERMELERLAEVAYAKLKKKIYKKEIPWEQLTQKSAENPLQEELYIYLPGLSKQRFTTKTFIHSWYSQSNSVKKTESHLIKIKMEYIPCPSNERKKKQIHFDYRLFVKQEMKKGLT